VLAGLAPESNLEYWIALRNNRGENQRIVRGKARNFLCPPKDDIFILVRNGDNLSVSLVLATKQRRDPAEWFAAKRNFARVHG
jgi:hypothetical protein